MTTWDKSVDLVCVGSGGGGLVAALAMLDAGLEPLIVEKQALVGGSTALSGGVFWMPNNPLMQAEGVRDSYADGLAHMEEVIGDVGPASSRERREAYLTKGPELISFLQSKGVELVRCPGYADYYSSRKGGSAAGRSIEGAPFDGRKLGAWQDKLPPCLAKRLGLAVKTNELRSIQYFNRSLHAFSVATRVFFRTQLAKLRRQDLLTNGGSLVGQILKVFLDRGEPPIWLSTPVQDLIVEEGRVVGIRVLRDGKPFTIEGRLGVLLAAGGFGHNPEMRRKYSGDQPNEGQWSGANPGDTGEVLAAAMELGAKVDLLDEAWWTPSTSRELGGSSLAAARQRPGAILVDNDGQRFCNEANSIVEVGKAMYASKAVPCWLIFDEGYARRYALTSNPLKRRLPQSAFESGIVKRAHTLEDLARMIEVDPDGLAATVKRFNVNAAKGVDPDFDRGESAYNTCMGDPGYKPNAALGPLDRAPYYATPIFPADVGTCGGVVTNEHAQVLDESDRPIPGLYATGNITATVMGRSYLGAGSSIAYTMVFGWVAAHHAASAAARS